MNFLRQVLVASHTDGKWSFSVNWRFPQNADQHMPDFSVCRGPFETKECAEVAAKEIAKKIGAAAFGYVQTRGTFQQVSEWVWSKYGGAGSDDGREGNNPLASICAYELI